MRNTFFGSWSNDSGNLASSHLFLLLIPALIYLSLVIFRKSISKSSESAKKSMANTIGAFMILTSTSFFIDAELSTQEVMNISFVFKNLNNYLLLILGVGILFKKYAFVKAFIPTAIVLALAPLVNNPENTLTSSHVVNNIILATAPLMVIFITNKSLTIKGLVISSITNLIILSFIFASNNIGVESVNLSTQALASNAFYGLFKLQFLQVLVFISAALLLEALIWLIIKFAFFDNRKNSFITSLQTEVRYEKANLQTAKKQIMYIEMSSIESLVFDTEELEELDELTSKEVIVKETKVYKFERLINTFSIIRTRNAQGTRAPSL